MGKITLPPNESLYPLPVALVTCCDVFGNKPNIITIAWCGVVCSKPPIISISVRPSRHSHKLIEESKEFAVNIPSSSLLKKVDLCGISSGKDVDKFKDYRLTKLKSNKIKSPIIKECPVNIECKLKETLHLGSHDLFLGEVVAVSVDADIVGDGGKIDFRKADPVVFNQGEYWTIGAKAGYYGYSSK